MTRCHGSSWVCLRPREMRWRSRSMSSTLTCRVADREDLRRWLTCDHESSEMWMRPSMPLRSTNAPKSTMFEMTPSTMSPGLQVVEDLLALLLALLLEHRAPGQHHVVARAVELDDLALDLRAHVLVEVGHAADVDERGGQEAAHPEVDDETALDDLDDRADDRSPLSAAASMRRHAFSKRARFLDMMRRPSWSSFVMTTASTSSPSSTSSFGSTFLRIDSSLAGMTPSLL